MAALFPRLTAIACVLALAACEMALPSAGGKAKGPNPVTGGDIEVTVLDDAPTGAAPAADAGKAVAGASDAVQPADPAPKVKPKPRPETVKGKAAAAEEAPPEDLTPPEAAPEKPEAEKSAAQLACEKKGSTWARAGTSEAHSCVTFTNDGGRQCTKGTQCDGECLARSGTCAPFKPLFGCNDILQDDGSRVTLCID